MEYSFSCIVFCICISCNSLKNFNPFSASSIFTEFWALKLREKYFLPSSSNPILSFLSADVTEPPVTFPIIVRYFKIYPSLLLMIFSFSSLDAFLNLANKLFIFLLVSPFSFIPISSDRLERTIIFFSLSVKTAVLKPTSVIAEPTVSKSKEVITAPCFTMLVTISIVLLIFPVLLMPSYTEN